MQKSERILTAQMEVNSDNRNHQNYLNGERDSNLLFKNQAPDVGIGHDKARNNVSYTTPTTTYTVSSGLNKPIFVAESDTSISKPVSSLAYFPDTFGKQAYGKTADKVKEAYAKFNFELSQQQPRSSFCGIEPEVQISTYSVPNWEWGKANDEFITDFPNSTDFSSRWNPPDQYSSNNNFFVDNFKESSLLCGKINENSADEYYDTLSMFSDQLDNCGMNFPPPTFYSELATETDCGRREDEIEDETEKLHTPPPISYGENLFTENKATKSLLYFPKSKPLEVPSFIPALKLARRLPPIPSCIPITSSIAEIPRCPLVIGATKMPLLQSQIIQNRPLFYSNFPIFPFYPLIPCQMLDTSLWTRKTPSPEPAQKKYVTVRELIEKKKRKRRNSELMKEETTVKKICPEKQPDVVTNISTTPVTSSMAADTVVRQPDLRSSSRTPPAPTGNSSDPNSATTLLCLMPAVPNVPTDFASQGNFPVVLTDFQKGKVNAKEHKPRHCEMKSLVIGTFKVEAIPSERGSYRNKFKIVFSKRLFIYEFEFFLTPNQTKMICVEVSFQSLVAMRCVGKLLQLRVKKQPIMYEGLMKPRAGIVTQTPVYDKQTPIDLTDGQLSTHPVHRIMLRRSQSNRLRDVLIRFDPWFHAVFATPIGDEKCLPLAPNSHVEWKITCQSLKNKEIIAEDNRPDMW